MIVTGGRAFERVGFSMRMPDGALAQHLIPMPPPRPWHSISFLIAFL